MSGCKSKTFILIAHVMALAHFHEIFKHFLKRKLKFHKNFLSHNSELYAKSVCLGKLT